MANSQIAPCNGGRSTLTKARNAFLCEIDKLEESMQLEELLSTFDAWLNRPSRLKLGQRPALIQHLLDFSRSTKRSLGADTVRSTEHDTAQSSCTLTGASGGTLLGDQSRTPSGGDGGTLVPPAPSLCIGGNSDPAELPQSSIRRVTRKRQASTDRVYAGRPQGDSTASKRRCGRPLNNLASFQSMVLVAGAPGVEPSIAMTVQHIQDTLLSGTNLAEVTRKAVTILVKGFFSHTTYNNLSKNIKRICAIAPGPSPAVPRMMAEDTPWILQQCVKNLTLVLHGEVKDADELALGRLSNLMQAYFTWVEVKAIYEDPEREDHAWLNEQVALARSQRLPTHARNISFLKIYVGSFLGYSDTAYPTNERLHHGKSLMGARFDREMSMARSAVTIQDIFGPGIFALTSFKSLHDIPHRILATVLACVHDRHPSLQTMCDILDRVYVRRMMQSNAAGVGIRLDDCRNFLSIRSFKGYVGDIAGLFAAPSASSSTPRRPRETLPSPVASPTIYDTPTPTTSCNPSPPRTPTPARTRTPAKTPPDIDLATTRGPSAARIPFPSTSASQTKPQPGVSSTSANGRHSSAPAHGLLDAKAAGDCRDKVTRTRSSAPGGSVTHLQARSWKGKGKAT